VDSRRSGEKLVAAAGLDLDRLFEQAQSREFNPIELPVHLQARVASQCGRSFRGMCWRRYWERSDTKRGSRIVHGALHHLGIDPDKKHHKHLQWRGG